MTEYPGFKSRVTMHVKLAKGGRIYVRRLVDYPGIVVTDNKQSRDHKTVRTVTYGGKDYETVRAAVDAWQADKGAVA